MDDMKFPVGTEFVTRGRHPRKCQVVDYLRTFNLAGELVKTRYVATYEFCGQTVTDNDVPETTIARGI